MPDAALTTAAPSREQLLHSLYEAAELEHCLMCTYLYAAFSLKSGVSEGLDAPQAEAVARWRRLILEVAIEEMSHLVAVWNITSALGGVPRIGRPNFPLDPGLLPAGVVVRLAPFNMATLQHFIHLERPADSDEPDGEGFAPERQFVRAIAGQRLTPMPMDYDTVGTFYETIGQGLQRFVEKWGESGAFCGDPKHQLAVDEVALAGAKRVLCAKTALAAFDAIITQGEGAREHVEGSHFRKFESIRTEYRELLAVDPNFKPAHPAATNPVMRRPPRPEGRVWLEDEGAVACVDLANASYGLMLRLLGYAYLIASPQPEKALTLDLAVGLMHAMVPLAEEAARLPAGPANPGCHAGVSFISLRDAAAFPPGPAARRFFCERFDHLAGAADELVNRLGPAVAPAAKVLGQLAERARRGFASAAAAPIASLSAANAAPGAAAALASVTTSDLPRPTSDAGVERIEGRSMTLIYEGRRCIHSRQCVTRAPQVFLANVVGPWIHPDQMDVDELVAIAHDCPSGAIRYERHDGRPNESAPPINLLSIREAGPYAVHAPIVLNGSSIGYRATLCRCGASKNKPFCDGSHHEVNFSATGEPPSTATESLATRDGALNIETLVNGPLSVSGCLEVTSGTGRVVARVTSARLCRCGGSKTKPFCDGTHATNGFVAD